MCIQEQFLYSDAIIAQYCGFIQDPILYNRAIVALYCGSKEKANLYYVELSVGDGELRT